MKEKAYNYVYEITYSDGRKYIGLRSCDCLIEEDSYVGSGFHIPDELVGSEVKVILSTHSTRVEAALEEIRLHALSTYETMSCTLTNAMLLQPSSTVQKKHTNVVRKLEEGGLKKLMSI